MDKTSIYKALAEVQTELKAPKGQYNSFGKYNYRSCEDILEAVKPLLKAHGLTLCLYDEPVMVGDWHYIKATAELVLFAAELEEQKIRYSAYAREPIEKKGMDDSQVTGATSSYARKYALNGLFCIDDTKDSDTNEYQKQTGGDKKTSGSKNQSKQTAKSQPAPQQNAPKTYTCACCGKQLTPATYKGRTVPPEETAASTQKKFGRVLCWTCAQKQPKEDGGMTHA